MWRGLQGRPPQADAAGVTAGRQWGRALLLGLLTALLYGGAVLAVVLLDFGSESQKLSRGAYTDTFRPLGFARLATAPLSLLRPGPHYPDGPFDERAFRAAIEPALHGCLVAAAVQTAFVAVVVTLVLLRRPPAVDPRSLAEPWTPPR